MENQGYPYKGTKSSTTSYLEQRYTAPPIISNQFPPTWIPHAVILEGMFMVQVSPLPTMNNMLLLSRFVRPHFNAGVIEVHVVFDAPGSQPESPKQIEQDRRDKGNQGETTGVHSCTEFCSDLLIPDRWRSVLRCRNCKGNLMSMSQKIC